MEDIIREALASEEAMTKLLRDLEPFVYRLSFHLTRHRQDAEDLAQEALYKICTRLPSYNGTSSLQTWVYTLVMNSYRDGLRRKKVRPMATESIEDHQPSVPSPEEQTAIKFMLNSLLKDLPEVDRRILILRFQSDLSVREVADILKLSEANVKTRLFRVRERLRQLVPQGGDAL